MTDLPDGWVPALLEHVCDLIGGARPDPPYKIDPSMWGGDIPYVRPTELGRIAPTDIYIRHSERTVHPSAYERGKGVLAPAGTVLLSTRASIGYLAVAGVDICIGMGITALVPNDRIADPVYLYGYLRRNLDDIRAMTNHGYIAGVRKSDLARFPIAVAPADEQRRIGDMLRQQYAAVADAQSRARKPMEEIDAMKASLMRAAMGGQTTPPTDIPEPVVFGVQQRMRI